MAESHERREVASKVREKAEERLLVGELRDWGWGRGTEEYLKWRRGGVVNLLTSFIPLNWLCRTAGTPAMEMCSIIYFEIRAKLK